MTLETAIAIVIVGLGVVPAIVLWARMADSLKMRVQSGSNDDHAAVGAFISVVKAAENTLIVHDDGNKMDGTVYDDRDAISAIEHQLNRHENLEIRFLFNEQADLDMVRELRAKFPKQVDVRYMPNGRPQDDIHYKIADDGTVGHLSVHEHAQPERHFKLFDCSATKPRSRDRVFGKYIKRFKQDFEAAQTL